MKRALHDIIDDASESLDYGSAMVTIHKAQGQLVRVDITKVTTQVVNGSAEALTIIGTMLKLLNEVQDSGELTLSIQLKRGQATMLLTQDFRRTHYEREPK